MLSAPAPSRRWVRWWFRAAAIYGTLALLASLAAPGAATLTGLAFTLTALLLYSAARTAHLQAPAGPDTLVLTVVGHMWWWEVRYRDPRTGLPLPKVTRSPASVPVKVVRTLSTRTVYDVVAPDHRRTGLPSTVATPVGASMTRSLPCQPR